MLPHGTLGFLVGRRRNRFIDRFPEAIDLMVRGLRSGLPITESLRAAGQEIVDPVGIELRRITDPVRLVAKPEEAPRDFSRRLDNPEFNSSTVALPVHAAHGRNPHKTP